MMIHQPSLSEPKYRSPNLNPLRWFPELWEEQRRHLRPQARLLGWALFVGVIAGLGAILFYVACQAVFHFALEIHAGYVPNSPGGEAPLFSVPPESLDPLMLLLIPALGGLVSGVLVYALAPEAEGHGTDAAIAAYHYAGGRIRPRVPLVKLVASAITLGTGGSGGREGPIAQIGAGFGSFLATVVRLPPAQRRVLMTAGMGAGIAAIFRAPLAGALFASEVLYYSPDFESEVIIPATLASVTAYCTFGLVFGWAPLFYISPELLESLTFSHPLELLAYLVLALFLVALATAYVRTFDGLSYVFQRLRLPRQLRPALGAFLSGALALALYYLWDRDERQLSVLSFGYGVLQDAMTMSQAEMTTTAALGLLTIALGKILTTSLTIGSGGSGGVFGPAMVIGGCGGGAIGIWLHSWIPVIVPNPSSFAIVGMAGFFAAAAKTPFSTLVMVSELTGSYNLLLPTLWVCTISFILSGRHSLYRAQVDKRSLSPAHRGDYVRDVLGNRRVRPLVVHDFTHYLQPQDSLDTIIRTMEAHGYAPLPVVDSEGQLLGVVNPDDLNWVARLPHLNRLVVAVDLTVNDLTPLRPDDALDQAFESFVDSGLTALPVIDPANQSRVIGVVRRGDLMKVYLQHVHGKGDAEGSVAEQQSPNIEG